MAGSGSTSIPETKSAATGPVILPIGTGWCSRAPRPTTRSPSSC